MPDTFTQDHSTVDAVSGDNLLLTGLGPQSSMVLLDLAGAQALGQAMQGALNRQQQAAVVTSSAIAAVCAQIVSSTAASRSVTIDGGRRTAADASTPPAKAKAD